MKDWCYEGVTDIFNNLGDVYKMKEADTGFCPINGFGFFLLIFLLVSLK